MSNPLSQYYRGIKHYIKLPSGDNYYPKEIAELTEMGELGIMPMTGRDELLLKNPDALLNGEATLEIIKSCVPGVKDAKKMLIIDIDAIFVAIKRASYGPEMTITPVCPSCGEENNVALNLESVSDNITMLDHILCKLNLTNGLILELRPRTYSQHLRVLQAQFEQAKTAKLLENRNLNELEKIKTFSIAFQELAELNFSIISECIVSVSDPVNSLTVTNISQIKEFMANIDSATVEKITKVTDEINDCGIIKEYSITCEKCSHKWETPMDFNTTDFFTNS